MPSYLDITIKLILGFFCLVLQINLSGKGNLALPVGSINFKITSSAGLSAV